MIEQPTAPGADLGAPTGATAPAFVPLTGTRPVGPMDLDATWDDFVAAHGGAAATGWWVTLVWFGDAPDPNLQVIGPYKDFDTAVSAMEGSLLIDSICEDTKAPETLDDVYVDANAMTIAAACALHGSRVTLIDPNDPDHFAYGA